MSTNRRVFLSDSLKSATLVSLGSLSAGVPSVLQAASQAAAGNRAETVLVVVQLSGGNDGLNTIVPYADDDYRRNRFTLRLSPAQVLKIDDYLGFHPSLEGMAELWENNQLAVVQGVGYPNPNRSHFESMDIWHSAFRKVSAEPTGWLGRYLDETVSPETQETVALHLGGEKQPLALVAQRVRIPSFESADQFKLKVGDDRSLRETIHQAVGLQRKSDDLMGFLQRSTQTALATSQRLQEAFDRYQTPVDYPGSSLARKLRMVARLIDAGLKTRIYYIELGGFDTHAEQNKAHPGLLRELGDAVAAFVKDLEHHGQAKRVTVSIFSEFGRRVRENASGGTDHGAAAPMLLAGGAVKAGMIGKHPSLTNLDHGDLRYHTDFRQVYATLLEDWLACPSKAVLDREYAPLRLFA